MENMERTIYAKEKFNITINYENTRFNIFHQNLIKRHSFIVQHFFLIHYNMGEYFLRYHL